MYSYQLDTDNNDVKIKMHKHFLIPFLIPTEI